MSHEKKSTEKKLFFSQRRYATTTKRNATVLIPLVVDITGREVEKSAKLSKHQRMQMIVAQN